MNFEHEQNKEKMLKLVEEKRKQALRRAEIAAREKKESELNLTAKRLEPDGKYFHIFSISMSGIQINRRLLQEDGQVLVVKVVA